MNIKSQLESLVDQLPELYQPIYGHPELTQKISRSSNDRWKTIKQIYRATSKKLGRPLNILDLGCSQGFFSLNLANAGAVVTGIDYLEENIAICRTIADEHPNYKIQFEVKKIEDFLPSIRQDQYDLVLGLSVFHHLIYEHDKETVTGWIADLGKKVNCGIFELALKSEPLYWADKQPDNPQEILKDFAFIHEVNRFATHLSETTRPLYFASNFIWYLDGKSDFFKTWKHTSHHLVGNNFQGSRQYFIGEKYITKLFSLDTAPFLVIANTQEIQREADFLRSPPHGFPSPHLITVGVNDSQSWLVRELLPGYILSEMILKKCEYNSANIIRDVLDQLCTLEANNLFHNDLRVWNILITAKGRAVLIDYSDITDKKQDVVWPHDLFLSFWIFIHEVVTAAQEPPFPHRQPFISPFNLPAPYQQWAMSMWSCPTNQWSFKFLRDEYQKMQKSNSKKTGSHKKVAKLPVSSSILWMRAMEEHFNTLNNSLRGLESRSQIIESKLQATASDKIQAVQNQLEVALSSKEAERQQLEAALSAKEGDRQRLDAALKAKEIESANLRAALDNLSTHYQNALNEIARLLAEHNKEVADRINLEAEFNARELALRSVYSSTSWKITAPVRYIKTILIAITHFPRRAIKGLLAGLVRFMRAHPGIKGKLARLFSFFPVVDRLVLRLFRRAMNELIDALVPIAAPTVEDESPKLSLRARQIHKDLLDTIEKVKKGG